MRRVLRQTGIQLLLWGIMAMPASALAESAFIIDRVEAGLHEGRSVDSPIIKLLPTGSKLEILERNDNRVQVRDATGTVGWLDQRFLMPDKPTRQLLNEAEAELERTRAKLQRLQEQQSANGNDNVSAEYQQLRQTRDRLENELAAERDKVARLRARVSDLEKPSTVATPPADQSAFRTALQLFRAYPRIGAAVLLVPLVIGLILGAWLLDYRNRRRHGGFRI